jgi:hypothetical protein
MRDFRTSSGSARRSTTTAARGAARELILAMYKSAETGKPVKLPLAADPVLKARMKGKKC